MADTDTEIKFEPTDVKRRTHISLELDLVGSHQPQELLDELAQVCTKHGHVIVKSEAGARS